MGHNTFLIRTVYITLFVPPGTRVITYLFILVRRDCYELRLFKSVCCDRSLVAIAHFHNMDAWLVLMEGIQHDLQPMREDVIR